MLLVYYSKPGRNTRIAAPPLAKCLCGTHDVWLPSNTLVPLEKTSDHQPAKHAKLSMRCPNSLTSVTDGRTFPYSQNLGCITSILLIQSLTWGESLTFPISI